MHHPPGTLFKVIPLSTELDAKGRSPAPWTLRKPRLLGPAWYTVHRIETSSRAAKPADPVLSNPEAYGSFNDVRERKRQVNTQAKSHAGKAPPKSRAPAGHPSSERDNRAPALRERTAYPDTVQGHESPSLRPFPLPSSSRKPKKILALFLLPTLGS